MSCSCVVFGVVQYCTLEAILRVGGVNALLIWRVGLLVAPWCLCCKLWGV